MALVDLRASGTVTCDDLMASDATEVIVSSVQAAGLYADIRHVVARRPLPKRLRWHSVVIRTEDA